MSKILTFSVKLTFESEIVDDNEILEIAKNIARAIKDEAFHGMGIAPDNCETYTKEVSVKPQFLDETITEKICD